MPPSVLGCKGDYLSQLVATVDGSLDKVHVYFEAVSRPISVPYAHRSRIDVDILIRITMMRILQMI